MACSGRLKSCNVVRRLNGFQAGDAHPAKAMLDFGNGRLEEVSAAADVPLESVGRLGRFATFLVDAGIPALLRGGAPEA